MPRLFLLLSIALAGSGALMLSGCTPHVGDHCVLNSDCSLQGTLVCDNSQNNGYCTAFNCVPDSCQAYSVCTMLYSSVPGCPYNGYQTPSRTGRSLCLKACGDDGDCRTSEGYVCRDPMEPPWNGLIIDDNPNQKVCVPDPDYPYQQWPVLGVVGDPYLDATPADATAAVCMPTGPVVTPFDAGGD
jgi:hypothetical protein